MIYRPFCFYHLVIYTKTTIGYREVSRTTATRTGDGCKTKFAHQIFILCIMTNDSQATIGLQHTGRLIRQM